jgi:hypothetical protein
MLTFFGVSDDLAEVRGDVTGEAYPGSDYGTVARIGDPQSGGCFVRMAYSTLEENGSWDLTVGRLDEGVPIPWAVTVVHGDQDGEESSDGYTVALRVACPPGTPVVWKSAPEDDWSVPS